MKRIFCVCLVILSACGATTGPLIDDASVDAGTTPRDAAPLRDAGSPDLGRDAGPPSDGLLFRLSFRSDVGAGESLYAQQSTSAHDGPGWLSIRTAGGAALDISGRCDVCACPTSGAVCLDCPRCGPSPDIVYELSGAGSLIEHRWDLLVHTTHTCDAGDGLCMAPPTMASPGDYIATFCHSATASGVGFGETVGEISCDEIPFHLPEDDGLVEDGICFCG